MNEQSFLQMLQRHPGALSSKQAFSGLLKDYFPQEPMLVNLIIALFEMGVHSEIYNTPKVTNIFGYRFVKRLMDEYGVGRENAENAVRLFCKCYGKGILNKPYDWEDKRSDDEKTGQAFARSGNKPQTQPQSPPKTRTQPVQIPAAVQAPQPIVYAPAPSWYSPPSQDQRRDKSTENPWITVLKAIGLIVIIPLIILAAFGGKGTGFGGSSAGRKRRRNRNGGGFF